MGAFEVHYIEHQKKLINCHATYLWSDEQGKSHSYANEACWSNDPWDTSCV